MLASNDIPRDVTDYGKAMLGFVQRKNFPELLLGQPDNVMIKSSSPADFQNKFQNLKSWTAEHPYFIDVDGRFLVAARLLVPMSLAAQRPVEWIEIMEPKSPDGTVDYFGAEYTEFFYGDFHKAELMLKKSRIDYAGMADPEHRWLNVRINKDGQEIRITDSFLAETIDAEVASGKAKLLSDSN